jgi:hypothetical protein
MLQPPESGLARAGGTDVEEARARLRELGERRARGDVSERAFRRELMDRSVELARAEARALLAGDEAILAEHHVVHSHFKVAESLLREPEQATMSLFATPRRLLRVCGTLVPGQVARDDHATDTTVDAIEYDKVRRIERKVERRWGEVATGAAIAGIALLFRGMLAITGSLLVLVGVAGVLHGLLLPTRWIEIVAEREPALPPVAIHGTWRKSARRVLAVIRGALPGR